jgi:hypothetical protein
MGQPGEAGGEVVAGPAEKPILPAIFPEYGKNWHCTCYF